MKTDDTRPRRWQPPMLKVEAQLSGEFVGGISNPEMMAYYALIMSYWPHVEEKMTEVLERLLFVDRDVLNLLQSKANGFSSTQQIFRSIGTNNYRIRLMKTLLERYAGNVRKSKLYDDAISKFSAVGAIRNEYAHGLWWTHR